MELLNTEGLKKKLGLDDPQFKALMVKDPPHLDIEGCIWFEMNEEFIQWLRDRYKRERKDSAYSER